MLYEKYRPQHLNEFVGNEPICAELISWLDTYYDDIVPTKSTADTNSVKKKSRVKLSSAAAATKEEIHPSPKKKYKSNILIMGDPGIGKTSLAHILLKTHGFDVIEFNASDVRNTDQIDTIFKDILSSSKNVSSMLNDNPTKIGVIMDEIDGLSTGDKGGLKRIQYYLQKNNYICPIILTCNISKNCNITSKKMTEMRKNCEIYSLEKIPEEKIYDKLYSIVQLEHLESIITTKFLNSLIRTCDNDFRLMLNSIDMIRILSKTRDLNYMEVMNYIENNTKDINYDIYQASEKIYTSTMTSLQVFNLFDLERYNLPIAVWDNLYKYIEKYDIRELHIILNILRNHVECISLEDQIYNKLNWDLFDSQCTLTLFTVYTLFREITAHTLPTPQPRKSCSKLLSRMNGVNANRDTREKTTLTLGLNSCNYHYYVELLLLKLLEKPENMKTILIDMDMSKDECLRLLKSADCRERILPRLLELGIITQKELDKIV
jgi:DNA polymerase III delta prime subunit